jgi:hypothetical protein
VIRAAGQTDEAATPLLPMQGLAQGLRAYAGQCSAEIVRSEVQLAGAFSGIENRRERAGGSH